MVYRAVKEFKRQVKAVAPNYAFQDIPLAPGPEMRPGYPADNGLEFVDGVLRAPGGYWDSVEDGRQTGARQVSAVRKRCPEIRLLFVGYSQGAQVTADLMQAFAAEDASMVLGGMFFGDPFFRGDSTYGHPGIRQPLYNPSQHGGLGQREEFSTELGGRVISMCHGLDVVCQGVSWRWQWVPPGYYPAVDADAHTSYTRGKQWSGTGQDLTEEAAIAARQIVSRMGLPGYFAVNDSPVDIVFAVDTTSSMFRGVQQAKLLMRELPVQSAATLANVRYGLVTFKEEPSDFEVLIEPTSNRKVFLSAVDRLRTLGGGERQESVLYAVNRAMKLPMRSQAAKAVVVVGDSNGAEPDEGLTTSGVIAAARKQQVRISAIDYGHDATPMFGFLAFGTGGKVVDGSPEPPLARAWFMPLRGASEPGKGFVASEDAEDNPLLNAVLDTASRPTARIDVTPVPVFAGTPTYLHSSRSIAPAGYIAKAEWDFDGDGRLEVSTTRPFVEHRFARPGPHAVSLRVTTDSGQVAVTRTLITVHALPSSYPKGPPATPLAPSVQARGGEIWVTVRRARGGEIPQSFTVTDARTGHVVGVVAATRAGDPVAPLKLRGMTPGRSYSFTVRATNVRGDSATSPPGTLLPTPRPPVRPPVRPPSPQPNPAAQRPSAVRGLRVTKGRKHRARVRWARPARVGIPALTGYRVALTTKSRRQGRRKAVWRHVTVKRLGPSRQRWSFRFRPGRAYRVSVQPFNAAGSAKPRTAIFHTRSRHRTS